MGLQSQLKNKMLLNSNYIGLSRRLSDGADPVIGGEGTMYMWAVLP
jgi:hypothetical protein